MPKITDPEIMKLTSPAADDRIHIVDVDDPTHDPAGSSKYIEIADLGKQLASTQANNILPGSVFCIFAEESAVLNANAFEWAFGNGDDSQAGFGIVIPFACELIAASLNIRQGSATVEVQLNGVSSGMSVTANSVDGFNAYSNAQPSIPVAAGDVASFQTLATSGATDGGKVAAWFKTL